VALSEQRRKHRRLLEETGFHRLAIYPAGLFSMIEARVG